MFYKDAQSQSFKAAASRSTDFVFQYGRRLADTMEVVETSRGWLYKQSTLAVY